LNHIDNAERNRRVLLNTIRDKGPRSRFELSTACTLSIATTKRLIEELMSQGLIAEGAPITARRARGRKASVLRLSGAYGHFIGVAVEPSSLNLAAIGFDGAVIYSRELQPDTSDRARLQDLIFSETQAAVSACAGMGRGPLRGMGVAIAGLVNTREGLIHYCPGLPGWENVGLSALMEKRFDAPVLIDDEVRCMALAEKRYGERSNLDTLLFLYIGRGVGAGIILDNRIYRGKNGISGEFGHITVRENGPLCNCGNRGCLEAVASSSAILARVHQLLAANVYSTLRDGPAPGQGLTLADVCAAAMAGDKLANMVVAEAEESIGIGVASLINIFDPGTVILAGSVIESFRDLIIEGVQRIVRRRALHTITQRTVIVESGIDANAAALGAATMSIERFLENEILNL
jgi:N-acetylglucosamine repressor